MTGLTAKALAPRLAAAMPERMHSGSARDHLEHRHPPRWPYDDAEAGSRHGRVTASA
jgi:hypothetical protein